MKTLGYVVIDACEDFEQILCLVRKPGYPPSGLLDWIDSRDSSKRRTVFSTRAAARAAVERTHHYALAFGTDMLPKRGQCQIEPVVFFDAEVEAVERQEGRG